jgi:hypothetical protein
MFLGKAGWVAAALAAGSLALATPAQAHGDDAAIAIGAGIVGLAVGAAIASDRGHRDVHVDYHDGGYDPRGYVAYGYPAYPPYPPYPVYRGYPIYRPYPAWRGHDPAYAEWRRWREHERRERRRGWRRGW